jgi:hypothetical protein
VIKTTHLYLNVSVYMYERIIMGTSRLTMLALQDAAEVILDTQGIEILRAYYLNPSGKEVDAYYDMVPSPNLGTALRIYLTDKVPAG